MSMAGSSASAGPGRSSQVNLAVGLAAATVILWVIFMVAQVDGPIWLLVAALGAVTAIVGWRTGQGSRPTGLALGAVVVGVVAVIAVVAWGIVDAVV